MKSAKPDHIAVRYLLAVAAVALVVLVRTFLMPVLGASIPLLPFVPAILLAAWFGGLGPGLLATALSAGSASWLFFRHTDLLLPVSDADRIRFWTLVLVGCAASLLFHQMRVQRERARRTAKKLWESEERFRHAMEAAPFPVAIYTEDGRIVSMSEVWTELSGYGRDEISTMNEWIARAFGARAGEAREKARRVFAEQARSDEGDFPVMTRSGESRIWHFHSAPLEADAEGRRVRICMATDVTEERLAEAELNAARLVAEQRASELEAVFAAIQDAVVVYDAAGWVVSCNLAAVNICGFHPLQEKMNVAGIMNRLGVSNEKGELLDVDSVPAAKALRGGTRALRDVADPRKTGSHDC